MTGTKKTIIKEISSVLKAAALRRLRLRRLQRMLKRIPIPPLFQNHSLDLPSRLDPADFCLLADGSAQPKLIPSYRQTAGQSMYAASMLGTGNRKKGKVRFFHPQVNSTRSIRHPMYVCQSTDYSGSLPETQKGANRCDDRFTPFRSF